LIASLAAGGGSALIVRAVPGFAVPGAIGALVRILTSSLVFVILYLAAIILLHGSFAPLYQFAGLLREMGPRRSSANLKEHDALFNNGESVGSADPAVEMG